MSYLYKSITTEINPFWVDWAYRALTTCYHHEAYGEDVEQEVKIKKVFEVIRRGHLSIAEHIHLQTQLIGVPHDVAMQIRTHRLASIQVTSQRYTGDALVSESLNIEDHFYFRDPGTTYTRTGKEQITWDDVHSVELSQLQTVGEYKRLIERGVSKEAARSVLAQGIRQSVIISWNLRALMDVIKMRTVKDAQPEIRLVMQAIIDSLPESLDPLMMPFLEKFAGKNHNSF